MGVDWRDLGLRRGLAHAELRCAPFHGYRAWRMLHYLSFGTFLAATAHGLMTGSDSHEPWVLFIYGAAVVGVVFLLNLRLVGGVREVRPPRAAATPTTPRTVAEAAKIAARV